MFGFFFLVSLFYGMVSIVWMLVCLFECICVYIYGWCGYGVVFWGSIGVFILCDSVLVEQWCHLCSCLLMRCIMGVNPLMIIWLGSRCK